MRDEINKLRAEMSKLMTETNELKTQVEVAKLKAHVEHKFSNNAWFIESTGKIRTNGQRYQELALQISDLKRKEKEAAVGKDRSLDTLFVDCAKELLPPKLFREILSAAKAAKEAKEKL